MANLQLLRVTSLVAAVLVFIIVYVISTNMALFPIQNPSFFSIALVASIVFLVIHHIIAYYMYKNEITLNMLDAPLKPIASPMEMAVDFMPTYSAAVVDEEEDIEPKMPM